MRRISEPFEKHSKKYGAFLFFSVGAAIILVLMFSGAADAAYGNIRYNNNIEYVPGFRFNNLVYAWDKLTLDVVNTTSETKLFSGKMIFLDRRGRPLATASLLPNKVTGMRSERYTAYFIEGSGEAARRAASIIWDFGIR